MQLKPIAEQVVVVVGASSGIGRATALAFAERGASLVVSAQDEQGLSSLVEEVTQQSGGQIDAVVADVADFAQLNRVGERAMTVFGRLDTWVHCAAAGLYATFEQTTPEEFERVIQVDLLGQVYGAMIALPLLRQSGGGSLIHISSVEAKRSLPFHSAYASAKHGVDGFLETLRAELAHDGAPINLVQILPGSVNTPFFEKSRTKIGTQPKGVPSIYEPKSVADAILFAAGHPARDVVVGGAALALIAGQRISPRLMDQVVFRAGYPTQITDQPKSPSAPNNLFNPMPTSQHDRVEGDFSDQARPSITTWLEIHPGLMRGLAAASLTVGATVLLRRSGQT